MKRRFFIFTVIAMVAMTMGLVSCNKDKAIPPRELISNEEVETDMKASKSYANYGEDLAYQYTLAHNGANSSSPYNSSIYISYSPNDCANFRIQCLYAGGIRPDANDNNAWWYDFHYQYTNPYDRSTYPWRSVSELSQRKVLY